MSPWNRLSRAARIKTIGYGISVLSVMLLGIVSWKSAANNPMLAFSLIGGALTSIAGMALRWWSYEVEKSDKN